MCLLMYACVQKLLKCPYEHPRVQEFSFFFFRCAQAEYKERRSCLIMCRPTFEVLEALDLSAVYFLFVFNLHFLFAGVCVCVCVCADVQNAKRFIMCCLLFDVMAGLLSLSLILLLPLFPSLSQLISLFLSLTCFLLSSPPLSFSAYSLSSSPTTTSLFPSLSLSLSLQSSEARSL